VIIYSNVKERGRKQEKEIKHSLITVYPFIQRPFFSLVSHS